MKVDLQPPPDLVQPGTRPLQDRSYPRAEHLGRPLSASSEVLHQLAPNLNLSQSRFTYSDAFAVCDLSAVHRLPASQSSI
jgi:hypothetical protein